MFLNKINKYLFYVLALFPILGFGILNITITLFIITIPFDLKTFSRTPKKKVFFIATLLLLSIIPLVRNDFQCSISYWLEKVLPLYIISVLLLLAPPYITGKDYSRFKNLYILGAVLYIFRFTAIVLIEIYNGKLGVVYEKKFLFYSDIMNLLRTEIDVLDSYYHKPYFSLIILMALFFITKKFMEEERFKILNLSLILFFIAAIVFPLSLPNIVLVFIYLFYLMFMLFKQKKILLSIMLLIGTTGFVLFFFYKSFKHNNLDITEDIGFITKYVKGSDNLSTVSQSNPRKIIYSALLKGIDEVPLLGYGYCKGKETVTAIVEESISKSNTIEPRSNLLSDTDLIDSHLWQKNGVEIKRVDDLFTVTSDFNSCKAHTFYQTVNELSVGELYTFSVSVKPEQSNVVLRLGKLYDQMVVFDGIKKQFSYIGKDILNPEIKMGGKGFYRIGITTRVKKSKNLALIGFSGKNNQYNHCYNHVAFNVRQPQLEFGLEQSSYNRGFSKNEKNILGSNINAHNVFLQEYYLGGIIGLISIVMLYSWFLYIGNRDKLLLIYVLAVLFNSLFENIQYRQIGISIVIIVSILLIFKKEE